jgi:hypothetical protein
MTLGEAMAEAIRESIMVSKLRANQHAVRAMKLLRNDREYQEQKQRQNQEQPQEPDSVRAEKMLKKYPQLRNLIIRRAELRMREHPELTWTDAVTRCTGEVVALMSSLRTIARLRKLPHVSVEYTHH